MTQTPLLVPVQLHALVVNDMVRKGQNFQRWRMNYRNLENFGSPMPAAFSDNTAAHWNNEPEANGIYLHWLLPRALRHGMQDAATSSTRYPLVPNRWLVTRTSGELDSRQVAAWVVESDFLDPNEGTTPYIDPGSPQQLKVTNIGRAVPLDQWSESGAPMFLDATGPGDVTFSAFQPYGENVFSFHDPLTEVGAGTVSYLVSGWYSDPAKDVLAGVVDKAGFDARLAELGWTIDPQPTDVCNTSLYTGASNAIGWDPAGPIPQSDRPDTATLAVGNSSIDALTALIGDQAVGNEKIHARLLEAFQYNLLPVLDQPNGPLLLDRAIHKAWYGTANARFAWQIIREPDDPQSTPGAPDYPDTPVDWDDPNLSPDWLGTLNRDQQALDLSAMSLQALQARLYDLWWTAGLFEFLPPTQQRALAAEDSRFSIARFDRELDPANPGGLAAIVVEQARLVETAAGKVPTGATQEELDTAARKFAAARGLPEGYRLRRFNSNAFYKPNDPVVLVAGAKSGDLLLERETLACRVAGQLVSGLEYAQTTRVNVAAMQGTIPVPDLTRVPIVMPALFDEAFFLDAASATMIASTALHDPAQPVIDALAKQIGECKDMIGTLPEIARPPWQQPWIPMFLMWKVQFYPIAHDRDGADNWTFDGEEYRLTDPDLPAASPKFFDLSGTTLLTPQARFNFRRRLEDFQVRHPDLDSTELSALDTFIEDTDGWDFLSQTLDGFNHLLLRRDGEANRVPASDSPIGKLIGDEHGFVPVLGPVPQPFRGWPTSDFQQMRSGQFCFERLAVVDLFGQSIEVVNSTNYEKFAPVRSPDLTPPVPIMALGPQRFIQLSPRILQPAQIQLNFLSATDDSKIVIQNSGTNPVCAWILPNHIDRALSCYGPDGNFVGELREIVDANGDRKVSWDFGPGVGQADLGKLPHLNEMVAGLVKAGPDAFVTYYRTIDETLWTIDPLGARSDQNLSVLVGRPLAMVRLAVDYDLAGMPMTDPSWQWTFGAAPPEFLGYTFPVRLGEVALRDDGLIGYFTGDDYSRFNAVRLPDGGMVPLNSDYVRAIEPGNFLDLSFARSSNAAVTMLVDPRAPVHATTGILPQVEVSIDEKFVEPALAAMNVTFHAGPLLSRTTTVAAVGPPGTPVDPLATNTSVILPLPSERNGTWDWLQFDGKEWEAFDLQQSDQLADFSNDNAQLRSGLMRLRGAIDKT
ncbi:hypothetical protein [Alteriqipengyuania lutimaris]|uniref:Uncharacterized protein n=1 Tax=Alteriqipengyuania lutimaris TaxID=1538146 RepID=A0A395LPG1_9SPHN|nr:hypothetical protein [Alteriqipengyuania lutimaris]MBB3033550.1 hypothetical protein [Alteriqipengyuania lutimaris]RDS77444.1 hypothetical protein DL238_07375 [Alteriqipengyuania lutimaris]